MLDGGEEGGVVVVVGDEDESKVCIMQEDNSAAVNQKQGHIISASLSFRDNDEGHSSGKSSMEKVMRFAGTASVFVVAISTIGYIGYKVIQYFLFIEDNEL